MQDISGYKGFGLIIDLNFDRFLMPGALVAALFAAAYLTSV